MLAHVCQWLKIKIKIKIADTHYLFFRISVNVCSYSRPFVSFFNQTISFCSAVQQPQQQCLEGRPTIKLRRKEQDCCNHRKNKSGSVCFLGFHYFLMWAGVSRIDRQCWDRGRKLTRINALHNLGLGSECTRVYRKVAPHAADRTHFLLFLKNDFDKNNDDLGRFIELI